MSEVENQGPSDDELLNEVLSDAPDDEISAEAVQDGKLVDAPETAELVAETPAEKPAVDDNAPQVPSWRVREINEEKRALADKVAALEARLAQAPQQQPQQEPKVEKPARPDPLLDPEGYATAIREEIRQEALSERREESLQRAAEANPDEFKEAYAAARQAVDPALKARMQSSRDPGKTLLEWHRENKTKAEIGNDLAAYKQRLRDEALKDPEFRKQAQAAWQSETQLPNGRPRVELPPSLNSTSRANTILKSDAEDVSDDELFHQVAG